MVRGHGKVILFGEHGVVHGRPALAVAVEGGAAVEYGPSPSPTVLRILPWDATVRIDGDPSGAQGEPLQRALRLARALYDDDLELDLTAHMSLPGGAGMGSSAALGVAVLRAMDAARGIERDDDEIFQRSLEWERVFHGDPSGVDNAMATYGGVAVFRRGAPLERLRLAAPLTLLAGDSGEPSSTKEMVASVARQYDDEPARVGRIFDEMAAIVHRARAALARGELAELGRLMTRNQALISALKLSTPTLDAMIRAAMEAGALGAKVTGGGGGGCMIALFDDAEAGARVRRALRALGKDVYDVENRG